MSLLAPQVKDVDQFWLQVAAVTCPAFIVHCVDLADVVDGDYVSGQGVGRETEANELFEVLDARRSTNFVVMTIEGEANGEVPARPKTADNRPCEPGEESGNQRVQTDPVVENCGLTGEAIDDPGQRQHHCQIGRASCRE